jgi:RNA recognition motif-containing protein
MVKKLFVGNLHRSVDNRQLTDLFTPHGDVVKATVVLDRQTGESRCFGFVEMATDGQGRKAMTALDGATVLERSLRIAPARERQARQPESNQRLRLRLPFRLVTTRTRQPDEE